MSNVRDNRYDDSPCGLLTMRPDGRITEINRTLLGWLGYDAHELVDQKRFPELLAVGDRIFYETHFAPLLRMQHSVSEVSLKIRRKDGTKFPALVSAIEVRDDEGRPQILRLALFAMGDRKKYETELVLDRKKAEQALRAKADFVSLLTHEIRTPLNSIIGVSHLLMQTSLSPEQTRYSDMLASSSENLMSLLNSILDYSKVDSGTSRIESRPFEFERTIRTTALAFQATALRKGIDLVVKVSDDIPESLCGDPVKIGQMITNLIGNAIKFTAVGTVSLVVELVEDTSDYVDLQFKVSDTGIGIPEDIIPKIFEEYSQADESTGVTYGGTGLGLAIVHKLAALHGSRISVHSKVAEGSTFSFGLRLKHAADVGKIHRDVPVAHDSLRGIRVLAADDSEDNQIILAMTMKRWGVEVTPAMNGQEVLAALAVQSFDIILMDLRMPVMDGYATTAAIRKLPDPRVANVPIIAFSASATLGDQDIVSQLQFQDILGKPYKPEELFRKVAALVEPNQGT